MTLWLYMEQHGQFPSLSHSALLRGVTKQAIQNHLEEAIGKNMLDRTRVSHTCSTYTILWDNLARTLGFRRENDVVMDMAVSVVTPKGVTSEEMSVRVRKPKDSGQMLRYFKAIYRERCGEEYTVDPQDKNRLRVLINRHTADVVREMIDYFAKYRMRLMLGAFTVQTLFEKADSLNRIRGKKG